MYEDYKYFSLGAAPGEVFVSKRSTVKDLEYDVANMFTSKGYGPQVDSPDLIIIATRDCIAYLENRGIREVHMPKINSGAFKVPWEKTEAVLKGHENMDFYVYSI
jgi:ADP-ribose 1''-phosphate phosphatase